MIMNELDTAKKHFSYVRSMERFDFLNNKAKDNKLIAHNHNSKTYSDSPEQICMEETRIKFIRVFLKKLLKRISRLQRHYLFAYIRNDYNASQTAEQLNKSQSTISRSIYDIRKIAFELVDELGFEMADFKEIVVPEICKFNSKYNRMSGYPYEHYINLHPNDSWICRFGRKQYPVNKTCLIPEYLECTCPNKNVVCPICNNNYSCTRIDKFPDNKHYSDKAIQHREKLDIMFDMIADEYTEEECTKFGFTKQVVLN